MLVGKLTVGTRERLLVTVLESNKGTKSIDCRVYNVLQDGELMPTAAGITVHPDQIDALVDILVEASKRVKEKV